MPWVTITPSLETFDDKEDARKAAIYYARTLWPRPLVIGWQDDTIMVRHTDTWFPTHIRVRHVDHHAPKHTVDYPGKEFR